MPMPRSDEPELLDRLSDETADAALRDNLRDIRRVNRYFGGTRAILGVIAPLLRQRSGVDPLAILDVATGSADIPLAVARLAEQQRVPIRIVATDLHAGVLEVARVATRESAIVVELADALDLPYGDGEFDIALCSLALHHFAPTDAVRLLAEMRRVSRATMIVNDLERSRLGLAGAWLVGHALTRNPMTRHDAPLSVRRAYTRAEARSLAAASGWQLTTVRRAIPFRYVLVGRP